ncbi:SAM-dependent methyltransferase [Brucepastera parasyntrophica]|uniref:SAM-dependent methyltransferase n=1 Tax=Brucepastera parasyntrophica TaxID=2880008 RepID=UPI00210C00D0|nr:SAM-dependent methyltransferase [Brucepastera parasyntrophica]ULQ59520.1 SAM-dependent methyltransferase [Brucepastera parasyntrophica]
MKQYCVKPIGWIRVTETGMSIELEKAYRPALEAIDGFSHLNVIWWFSDFDTEEARSVLTVPRPYRKAPEQMGILATRSPVRPNPIALSTVQVCGLDHSTGTIEIAWIDAHDGSPVIDIKPYTPSMDRVESPGVPDWCAHWPGNIETSGEFDWSDEFEF